jgi:hypothetical protein
MNELNYYPSEPASSDSSTTKFRSGTMEAYFRSRTEVEAAWNYINSDVIQLTQAMKLKCSHLADPIDIVYNVTSPTVSDDTNAGYLVGTVWIDTTTGVTYTCTSNTAGNAVWS